MGKKDVLPEQKIVNFSFIANAYRNLKRYQVDRLFLLKTKASTMKEKRMFDFLARQKWRKIIKKSNELNENT